MAQRTSYTEGTPNWVDLGTPDLAGARQFYGDLLGWTFQDAGEEAGHYTMCLLGGLPVAAIAPQQDPGNPRWSTYLASDDARRTADRITEAGGKILMGPMDVFEQGTMLFAADPGGAPFGVWQGRVHPGARRVNEPGAFIWNELHTRDGAAADAFYRGVFGHDLEKMGDGQAFDYSLLKVGDEIVGGRNQLGAEDTTPPGWLTYFAVDDTDAAIAAATERGGTVVSPAHDSEYGRMAVLADPWGAVFAVITVPAGDAAAEDGGTTG